jgi:hypothetical protein
VAELRVTVLCLSLVPVANAQPVTGPMETAFVNDFLIKLYFLEKFHFTVRELKL